MCVALITGEEGPKELEMWRCLVCRISPASLEAMLNVYGHPSPTGSIETRDEAVASLQMTTMTMTGTRWRGLS